MRLRKMSRATHAKLQAAKGQNWRRKKLKLQGGRCAYCEKSVVDKSGEPFTGWRAPTLDHVVPLSRGGEHHWENVVVACHACNAAKGAMTADEFTGSVPAQRPIPSQGEASEARPASQEPS